MRNILATILYRISTGHVKKNNSISYRALRPVSESAIEAVEHFDNALVLLRNTDKLVYNEFTKIVKHIHFVEDLNVSINFPPNKHLLFISLPYFLELGSSDNNGWFTGLSACVMVRIAYLGRIQKKHSNKEKMEIVHYSRMKEVLFADKLGRNWSDYYSSDARAQLPLIFPIEPMRKGN